ncbi:MAG TPA: hypothetical protein VIV15_02050 [Anaerolineales bacterium]
MDSPTQSNIKFLFMVSPRKPYSFLPVLILVLCLSLIPVRVSAIANSRDPKANPLIHYVAAHAGDQEGVIGVVAAGGFSFPVVQQDDEGSVSVNAARNTVTQFGMAASLGNIGLLAHNYLAGRSFFDLKVGQRVYLVYGTGMVEAFAVSKVLRYQALTPRSPYSEFREAGGDTVITAVEMFYIAYGGSYHVTFQTCIAQDGDNSWGRLFVIAEPMTPPKQALLNQPERNKLIAAAHYGR